MHSPYSYTGTHTFKQDNVNALIHHQRFHNTPLSPPIAPRCHPLPAIPVRILSGRNVILMIDYFSSKLSKVCKLAGSGLCAVKLEPCKDEMVPDGDLLSSKVLFWYGHLNRGEHQCSTSLDFYYNSKYYFLILCKKTSVLQCVWIKCYCQYCFFICFIYLAVRFICLSTTYWRASLIWL